MQWRKWRTRKRSRQAEAGTPTKQEGVDPALLPEERKSKSKSKSKRLTAEEGDRLLDLSIEEIERELSHPRVQSLLAANRRRRVGGISCTVANG